MRTLLRPCLGCGTSVRGKLRCADCERAHQHAKRARRPDLDDAAERRRRRELVADHVVEVAAGGLASGPLRVLCRSENSRRSAWLATGLGPLVAAAAATPRTPKFPTLLESTDPGAGDGPVVA